jgi:hypothetical protein
LTCILVVISLLMLPIVMNAATTAVTDNQADTYAAAVVSNGTAADATGTMTGSPVSLTPGVNTPTITVAGTFTVTLPVGMTGSAVTGAWVVTGSPKALVAGANTVTVEVGGGPGTITINATGGGTTAVVLTEALYRNAASSIVSMTADGAPVNTPTYQSYVSGTKTLTIRGLGISSPQAIVVTYRTDSVSGFTGVGDIAVLVPLLFLIAVVILAIFTGYKTIKE